MVLVVLFCDSDRVGRGERSRASDACEKRMQLLAWTGRVSHAEALPGSAAENSSPLSLRLYIRYGSSISISIDLSLIHGISGVTVAVADGENPESYCNFSTQLEKIQYHPVYIQYLDTMIVQSTRSSKYYSRDIG